MSLHVIEPGLATMLVDFGRPGSRRLGVAVGGAADRTSLSLGNGLVGNPPNAVALEITMAGPTLRAECDLLCVLFGAPFELSAGRRLTSGTTFILRKQDELTIRGARHGLRGYLCVEGGFEGPAILGSKSALAPLKTGEVLSCAAMSSMRRAGRSIPVAPSPPASSRRLAVDSEDVFRHLAFDGGQPRRLRVTIGAQADWFVANEFYRQEFSVSSSSNRMGVRLRGQSLTLPARELVSEPVSPGAVQVTRDGQCIILGVDGQTIGGYPKVAHVISADLNMVGQLRPGEQVRFELVDLVQAEQAFAGKQVELLRWLLRLRA